MTTRTETSGASLSLPRVMTASPSTEYADSHPGRDTNSICGRPRLVWSWTEIQLHQDYTSIAIFQKPVNLCTRWRGRSRTYLVPAVVETRSHIDHGEAVADHLRVQL